MTFHPARHAPAPAATVSAIHAALIHGERHLRQILAECARHDNEHRPSQSGGQRPPLHEPGQAVGMADWLTRRQVVRGLINEYRRAA